VEHMQLNHSTGLDPDGVMLRASECAFQPFPTLRSVFAWNVRLLAIFACLRPAAFQLLTRCKVMRLTREALQDLGLHHAT